MNVFSPKIALNKDLCAQAISGYKNSYRGYTLLDDEEGVKALKRNGIKTVINCSEFMDYGDLVVQNGMNYIYCEYDHLFEGPMNRKDEDIDKLTDALKAMREGDFYLSCAFGMERSKHFISLISLLNPDVKAFGTYPYFISATAEDIYDSLTPEHKEKIGYTEYDDKMIKARIDKALYT